MGPVLSNELHAVTFVRSDNTWRPAGSSAEVPSNQVPDSLKAAIKAAVEARGERYAGFCREVNQSPNPSQYAGHWCAAVQSLTADRAVLMIGAVFSDELHAVTFVRSGNTWAPADSSGTPRERPLFTISMFRSR